METKMNDTSLRTAGMAEWLAAAGETVATAAGAMGAYVMRRFRRWQTERTLMSLSDEVLKDIGLSRSEITSIAHGIGHDKRTRRHATE
jgi:uncharacterized protein YjiS (DUF1127 family)